MLEKPSVTLPGKVEKIITSLSPEKADTAQISIEPAHDLYRDVRIENTLTNESGGKVSLKLGSPVEVSMPREGQIVHVSAGILDNYPTPLRAGFVVRPKRSRGLTTQRQLLWRTHFESATGIIACS